MTKLLVDYCSYEAAKYAVKHWYYRSEMPAGSIIKIGAWEDDKFIGCIIFGKGANNSLGSPYGLVHTEVCEMVRVAFTSHQSPMSKILKFAIKKLKQRCPDLKLIISFADQDIHYGGIYQATNWIYSGLTDTANEYIINGERVHGVSLRKLRETRKMKHLTSKEFANFLDPNYQVVKSSQKHRYLFPLDRKMTCKLQKYMLPYPKPADD